MSYLTRTSPSNKWVAESNNHSTINGDGRPMFDQIAHLTEHRMPLITNKQEGHRRTGLIVPRT